jgi:xylulokinase
MGDAIVAAVSAGIYPSLEAAVAAMVTSGQSYQPDPANAACYDALYQVYLKLYPQLRDLFRELGEAPCG